MAGVIEFYKGQNIFMTGATGFIGKVLIEKLLRSCPQIGNIYVLIRPKKGKDISQRLQDILSDPLYDTIKRINPENLNKVIPLKGDCSELCLGLSADDQKLLIDEVSVVFHGAANVRFDDPLKSAVRLNIRGAREAILLSRSIKNLKVHVHISTTYSNCDRPEVDEIIYPAPADWRKVIEMAETLDDSLLGILTKKIIGLHPNTYIFSKSLAEHVVKDIGENMPVIIFRPSIVVATLSDPVCGWVDNFNGPIGLFVAAGKGLLRTVYADPDITFDLMPVDVCVKFILLASWLKATSGDNSEPTVYNSSSYNLADMHLGDLINLGFGLAKKVPFNGFIWWPSLSVRKSKLLHNLEAIFFQLLPGMIIDGFLKLSGKKPLLVNLQQKIYSANMALEFFMTRSWIFYNDRLLSLRSQVLPCDKKEFNMDDLDKVDLEYFFIHGINGIRFYLLKEHPDSLPKAKAHARRMYWLDKFVRTLVISSVLWFIIQKVHINNIHQDISSLFS